jgi:hypothetical protein
MRATSSPGALVVGEGEVTEMREREVDEAAAAVPAAPRRSQRPGSLPRQPRSAPPPHSPPPPRSTPPPRSRPARTPEANPPPHSPPRTRHRISPSAPSGLRTRCKTWSQMSAPMWSSTCPLLDAIPQARLLETVTHPARPYNGLSITARSVRIVAASSAFNPSANSSSLRRGPVMVKPTCVVSR